MASAHDQISDHMKDCKSLLQGEKDGAIVALCEKVLKLLLVIGLAIENVILHPLTVGVHFDNRYGVGIKAEYMHKLAAKIYRSGFRWTACSDAICIEEDDNGGIGKFTRSLQARSSKLGKQNIDDIRYGSVACSHLNQWLVAALCGAECDEDEMAVDCRMSADNIRAKQPELADALNNGLKWTIVKKEAVKRWPQLPKLIQEARQIAGQIHNGETHFELLEAIQSTSVEMADDQTGSIDWEAVTKAVSITENRYIDDIPNLCILVQKYGGGTEVVSSGS